MIILHATGVVFTPTSIHISTLQLISIKSTSPEPIGKRMYGIRKQSWQRHKVERTPSAALNQYNRVCDSESGLFLLINTYTYSIIYLKYMKFCHGKNFTHYMFMILIDTRTIIEKNLLTHHIFFLKWVG